MNDETQRQLEQLERATAADLGDDQPLDAETAELRAGWLAFGRLLKAAEARLDAAAVVPTVDRTERRRRMTRVVIAAALAASLVLAFGVWRFASRPNSPASSGPRELAAPAPVKKAPTAATAANAALAWDDSLDSHFTELQTDLAGWRYVPAPADSAFSVLSDQMLSLRAEFSGEL